MPALSQETTRALAECEDTFIAKAIATGAAFITETTSITTADAAKAELDKLFVQLWNNGVSTKDKITLYLTPWFYDLFSNKLIELKTNNDALIAKDVLGMYKNASVKMTNNAYNDGTDDYIILKTSKAFAYANGINEMEAYRPEKLFSDAIKGLNTYGGKTVRPKEAAVLKCHNSK